MSASLPFRLPLDSLSTMQVLWIVGGIAVAMLLVAMLPTFHKDDRRKGRGERSRVSGVLQPEKSEEPDLYRVQRSRQWVRPKAAADPTFRRKDDVDQVSQRETSLGTGLDHGMPSLSPRAEGSEARGVGAPGDGAARDAASARDEGSICPFLSTLEQGDGFPGSEGKHACRSRPNERIMISAQFVTAYCLTAQHQRCGLYLQARVQREPGDGAGGAAPAAEEPAEPSRAGDTISRTAEGSPGVAARAAHDRDGLDAATASPQPAPSAQTDVQPDAPEPVTPRRLIEMDTAEREVQQTPAGILDVAPMLVTPVRAEVHAIPIEVIPVVAEPVDSTRRAVEARLSTAEERTDVIETMEAVDREGSE